MNLLKAINRCEGDWRRWLVAVCVLAPGGEVAAQGPPPVRGRDPWAFRLTMENRTRMLMAALRSDLWVSYNPANGTLHRVWSGGMQFRGKVYDFGNRNSVASGTTYYLPERANLFSVTNESIIPAGWTATGVSTGSSSWSLGADSSAFVSPAVDLRKHDQVLLSYQTTGGNNRLLVDVSTDNGASWTAQNWTSIDGAASDGHMKLLAVGGDKVRIRFRRNPSGGSNALLSDVTLFGNYRAWSLEVGGEPAPLVVDWRGYRLIGETAGIVIRYDLVLADGARISVEESPEALAGRALSRRFVVGGLPEGARLSLELGGTGYKASHSVRGAASLREEGGGSYLDFTLNEEATLETVWTP